MKARLVSEYDQALATMRDGFRDTPSADRLAILGDLYREGGTAACPVRRTMVALSIVGLLAVLAALEDE